MPNRPQKPGFVPIIGDHDYRIRNLERTLLFPPVDESFLEALDNGRPIGAVDRIDFGAGISATPLGERYIRVTAAGAQVAAFDAVVDFLAETDEKRRLFGGATGISDALEYLLAEGLTHAAVLVRATGTYTETANWTNPGQVLLFGVPGSTSSASDELVRWNHAGFSGSSSTGWQMSNFAVTFGAKGTGFVSSGTALVKFDNCLLNCLAMTGSRILSDASYAIYNDCVLDAAAQLGAQVNVKGMQVLLRGNTVTLATQFIQGDISYTGSNTDTWTLPSSFASTTDLTISFIGISRISGGGTPGLNLICNDNGIYRIVSNSGLTSISANGGHAQLDLYGTFGAGTIAAPSSNQTPTRIVGGFESALDLTGPADINVGLSGGNDHIFRGSMISGSITSDGETDTNGTWLDFIAADRCSLIVSSSTGNGGTRKPWAFDGSCDNNILVFRDSSGFAAAGTGHGANGNLIVPDSFFVPAASPTAGWGSITNVTTTRAYDADSVTLAEIADTLGTLVNDLINQGVLDT